MVNYRVAVKEKDLVGFDGPPDLSQSIATLAP